MDGQRLRTFNSLRLQRFLALLALRRDLQHRSRLAFELWPDSDERQARTNLRKLLHDFRHSLPDIGEFVQIDNEIVRWIPTGPADVDVLRFRDALAAGDLELAARVYSGDLLPACYDDWALDERAKLRAEAYGALVRLTEEAAGRDNHQATIRHAQRIIDLEPTDEAAVRIQMEAHLALGDRAAALRCYHRYAEALERDLGVAPGAEIGAVYQQLALGLAMASASSARCSAAPAVLKPGIGGAARSWARTAPAHNNERSVTCARRLEEDDCMRSVRWSVQLRHGSPDRHAQLRFALRCAADARCKGAEQAQHLALHERPSLANPECVERTLRENTQLLTRLRAERRERRRRLGCRRRLPLGPALRGVDRGADRRDGDDE